MTAWAILDENGALVAQVISDGHPCDPTATGPAAYDCARDRVVKLPALGDLSTHSFDGKKMIEDAAKLEDVLLREIDFERDRRALDALPARFSYQRKGAEARDAWAMDEYDRAGLSSEQLAERFPWLWDEKVATGLTFGEVLLRVHTAMQRDERKASRIEAAAVAAKDRVRAAVKPAAKRAAAAVNWDDI